VLTGSTIRGKEEKRRAHDQGERFQDVADSRKRETIRGKLRKPTTRRGRENERKERPESKSFRERDWRKLLEPQIHFHHDASAQYRPIVP